MAINSWSRASGKALGWYCLWAAVASLFLAVLTFARYHDPRFGMLWLLWTVLFTLFFLVLAPELKQLERGTGWATTFEAFSGSRGAAAGEWRAVPGDVGAGPSRSC